MSDRIDVILPRKTSLWILIAAEITVSLLILAGCHGHNNPAKQIPLVAASEQNYVGNAACATCHPSECAGFSTSRHATTLHLATRESLGKLCPPTGVIPHAGYSIEEKAGRFVLTKNLPEHKEQPLTYVLGSGKLGMTYVTVLDSENMLETHMSFSPNIQSWNVTPGQEKPKKSDLTFGRLKNDGEERRCLLCHATSLPKDSLITSPQFFGVGCEACHGPGKEHIDAVHSANSTDLHMINLGKLNPTDLNEACGKCHRSALGIDINSKAATKTHRFQPYALSRSLCRTSSGEPLSCLSCHNPHKDVSHDKTTYNLVCLSCHSNTAQQVAKHSKSIFIGKICPVNAKTECITCHMRPKKAFPLSAMSATMVDHLISQPGKMRK